MFNDFYKNKKILVTGHTGFKGSWLCAWLNKLGADVYGLSNEVPTDPAHIGALKDLMNVTEHFVNILDEEALNAAVKKIQPDFVFHLAAQAIVKDCYLNPILAFKTNLIGSLNVFNAIQDIPNLLGAIFITSDKCYENVEWEWGYRETDALGGKDPYSASKACAEIGLNSMFQSYGKYKNFKMTTVRAGNVIGGGDWANYRIVPDLVRAWSEGQTLEIRSPKATRPWQLVLEPLSGYLHLGEQLCSNPELDLNGEAFNFGPNSEVNKTVEELLVEVKKSIPDLKWETNEVDTNQKEAMLLKLSCDKALHHLKWTPVLSFPETIEMTANWYKSFYKEKQCLTLDQIARYESLAQERGITWTQ